MEKQNLTQLRQNLNSLDVKQSQAQKEFRTKKNTRNICLALTIIGAILFFVFTNAEFPTGVYMMTLLISAACLILWVVLSVLASKASKTMKGIIVEQTEVKNRILALENA